MSPRHGARKALLRHFHAKPPPYWRRITRAAGISGWRQRRDLALALDARAIPFKIISIAGREHFYVPPVLEQAALAELAAYEAETGKPVSAHKPFHAHTDWIYAPLYMLPMLAVYSFDAGGNLKLLGALDNVKVFVYVQWHRIITALWLHADAGHLAGNCFFGALFLCLLARVCGIGRAWLIACLGGIAGNFASAFIHKPGYASVGFSTAVFAALGGMGGVMLARSASRPAMPIAAALALLAMLGTAGANTDYGAHICGLGAGMFLGIGLGMAQKRGWPLLPQWLAGALALVLPLLAYMPLLKQALDMPAQSVYILN